MMTPDFQFKAQHKESHQNINCVVLYTNPSKGKTVVKRITEVQPNWNVLLLPSSNMSWEKELSQLAPDVVFFELEGEINLSLRIVDQIRLKNKYFHLVLITEDIHIKKVLQVGAFGYLNPEFTQEELNHINLRINCAIQYKNTPTTAIEKTETNRLMIQNCDGFNLLNIDEIKYLRADGCYTNIHTKKEKLLVTRRLKDYNFLQKKGTFFRPHRSYIINLNFISSYVKHDGGYIQMSDGEIISLSRDKKNDFFQLFLGS